MTWGGGAALAAFASVAGASQAAQGRGREVGAREMRTLFVEAVQMPAWIDLGGGRREPLQAGDPVSTAQEVETGAGAALALRMPEGSLVRLGEKSRLQVQSFAFTPSAEKAAVDSRLRLVEGFFRFTSGVVASALAKRDIAVQVRTATIGIRGTDFWSMTDAAHDAACLFEGRIDIASREQGDLVLDKPTAFWARFFDRPVQPVGNATPEELSRFLRSTEMVPGQGIAVVGGRWRVVAAAPTQASAAQGLANRLRGAGYPAVVKQRSVAGRAVHEVRVNAFATREDAQAVLRRIEELSGVPGRVALSA